MNGKPNFLIIMTDQQRYDALSCHGGTARTPHLDKLASEGVDFQKHFANSPVCVPSRCTIFTGRYPNATRVRENDSTLAPTCPHLFKLLHEAGYHLGYAGKNHLLDDVETENFDFWDEAKSEPALEDPSVWAEYSAFQKSRRARMAEIGSWASAAFHDYPDEVTGTGRIGRAVEEQIRAAPADRPFCMVASFHDPHAPHLAPRRFAKLYPFDSIELPDAPEGCLDTKAPRFKIKREAQGSPRATEDDKKKYLACYYAMCSYVDEQVGRMMEALATREDADNTIVVFLSDHGDFNWHFGMHKKDLVTSEHLLHVPFIIRAPGRFGSRRLDHTLSENVDLVPTILDLAGMDGFRGMAGKSLKPLLDGSNATHKDSVYAEVCYPWERNPFTSAAEFAEAVDRGRRDSTDWPWETTRNIPAKFNVPGDHNRSVRDLRFRYVWYARGFEELYDVERDPHERINLAGDPCYAQRLENMRLKLFRQAANGEEVLSPREENELAKRFAGWRTRPFGS